MQIRGGKVVHCYGQEGGKEEEEILEMLGAWGGNSIFSKGAFLTTPAEESSDSGE